MGQQHGVLSQGEEAVVLEQDDARPDIQLFDHGPTAFQKGFIYYTIVRKICHPEEKTLSSISAPRAAFGGCAPKWRLRALTSLSRDLTVGLP